MDDKANKSSHICLWGPSLPEQYRVTVSCTKPSNDLFLLCLIKKNNLHHFIVLTAVISVLSRAMSSYARSSHAGMVWAGVHKKAWKRGIVYFDDVSCGGELFLTNYRGGWPALCCISSNNSLLPFLLALIVAYRLTTVTTSAMKLRENCVFFDCPAKGGYVLTK